MGFVAAFGLQASKAFPSSFKLLTICPSQFVPALIFRVVQMLNKELI